MQIQPFIVTPENRARALSVLGVQITVLASNAATGGYELTLQEGDEGVGPPPHSHAWDESFFVLEGTVEIVCNGRTTLCRPGTLVHVPGGTVHGYRFGAGGGRMLEVSSKGGRATQMFTNVSKAFPSGRLDVPRLVDVLAKNGVSVAA